MGNKLSKLDFSRKQLVQFLLIVSNSQLVYAFIAIRSVLYDPFLEALGVNNTQFGVLMGFIGLITTFGNIAFGWVQDRFSTRKVLAVNSFVYGILALFVAIMPQSPFFHIGDRICRIWLYRRCAVLGERFEKRSEHCARNQTGDGIWNYGIYSRRVGVYYKRVSCRGLYLAWLYDFWYESRDVYQCQFNNIISINDMVFCP